MTEEEQLEVEIAILQQLDYTIAYTGSLDKLKPQSYVLLADVIAKINKRRKRLQEIKKEKKGYEHGNKKQVL
jgi:hypothetical protein